jgi:hypothetical protein
MTPERLLVLAVCPLPQGGSCPCHHFTHHHPWLVPQHALRCCCAGYCDGASHQRQDVYRQSPYDSGVLVLQTSAAAAKWRVSERLERQLVDAFAACCPSAAAVERQRRRRGAADLELQGLVGGSGGGSAGGGSGSAQAAMCGEQQQQQHKKKMKQQQQQKLLKRQRRAKRLPSIAAMTEADMQDMASKATAKRARSSKHTVPDT